jgi:dipeptidase E
MGEPTIVALGGLAAHEGGLKPLLDYILGLTGKERPRVCFVPTATGDDADAIVLFYDAMSGRGEPSYLPFFPWPPSDFRELALSQDAIWISGGNTANMLAIWRVYGFDAILREAWEQGIVLAGWSAGMICWFEAAVTDSFGPELAPYHDCLGFLPGSACPHYDGEERRRPVYTELVGNGFPPGYAADDGVGLHFKGTRLAEVISARRGARAYRVEAGSETPIEPRLL